jgi:hypothetical protein
MAYVDAQLLFSDEQAVTSTAASTNYIDLGAVRDIGTGEDLYVVCLVDVAMTDAGSDSTVAVALEGDSTTTFTPDGTQTLFSFAALSARGTVKIAKLSPGADPLQYRYIQLKYTVSGGDLTTGKFTAYLTNNIDKYVAYADGFTIS